MGPQPSRQSLSRDARLAAHRSRWRHTLIRNVFKHEWIYRDAPCSLALARQADLLLPAPNFEEEFITEHYWDYCKRRGGGTVEYKVEHPGWRVWRASSATADIPAAQLYGIEFAEALNAPPSSALLAEGSTVDVHRAVRIA